jgi:hypothetical protein
LGIEAGRLNGYISGGRSSKVNQSVFESVLSHQYPAVSQSPAGGATSPSSTVAVEVLKGPFIPKESTDEVQG